jgi:hypothetical protein
LEEEDMMEGLNDFAEQHPVDLFLISTQDSHLVQQYFEPAYQKTQSCQTYVPLLNLYQQKTKPCAGSCAYCHKKEKDSMLLA